MPSEKTDVIKQIFRQRWNPTTKVLSDDLVTFDDLIAAIPASGAKLRTTNPANFWKDLTRSANEDNWPADVLADGYTGSDAIGADKRASFRFVPLPPGQKTAFPPPPTPPAGMVAVPLQSVSLPLASRVLGRRDETWLAQVAYRLNIIESHFVLASPRPVKEVDFLQVAIKLGKSEIDVAYRITEQNGDRWLVTVEAKGFREKIWVTQVARQADTLWSVLNKVPMRRGKPVGLSQAATLSVKGIIPFAIKIVGNSIVHTVEFSTGGGTQLSVVSQGLFELRPPVEGIR